tara:strand:- start:4452 stop:5174 length:723 start_codon:yes stop_codon:yes gene_type:complete
MFGMFGKSQLLCQQPLCATGNFDVSKNVRILCQDAYPSNFRVAEDGMVVVQSGARQIEQLRDSFIIIKSPSDPQAYWWKDIPGLSHSFANREYFTLSDVVKLHDDMRRRVDASMNELRKVRLEHSSHVQKVEAAGQSLYSNKGRFANSMGNFTNGRIGRSPDRQRELRNTIQQGTSTNEWEIGLNQLLEHDTILMNAAQHIVEGLKMIPKDNLFLIHQNGWDYRCSKEHPEFPLYYTRHN